MTTAKKEVITSETSKSPPPSPHLKLHNGGLGGELSPILTPSHYA